MDFAPDSIPYSELGFISQHKKVFSPDEVSQPDDKCNTVAVAPRYGLVFCSNGSTVKVFQSQALLSDGEPPPLAVINTGCPITHLTTSCDGLTLVVFILQDDKPKSLFYEIRFLVAGCESPAPYAVSALGGSRVQAIAWNPMDPCSVAIATSPGELSILSIKDDKIDAKSKPIKASALSWSPKGKQLTVGLADGTLALFKPDLQLVRIVKKPPMEEASTVQSITWFTNTEFFIGYKIETEEGAQVMMYVNAPKAQEPKFILYEFICNENLGPRPAMFYQVFLPEWSVLCLASSRACQLGVLGQVQAGSWCEFELEEGRNADMHSIYITETTFPMGMAIDFTSLKSFTNKVTGKVSGPSPVLYVMSTGGELNIFHVANSRQGAASLVALSESLPKIGQRIADQYKGSANSALSFATPPPVAPASSMQSPFMSPSPGMQSLGGKLEPPKTVPSSDGAPSAFGASLFGGTTQPKTLLPKFTTQAPLTAGIGSGMTLGKSAPIQFSTTTASPIQFSTAATSSPIQFNTTTSSPGLFTQTLDNKDNQKLKMTPSIGDANLGVNPLVSTPIKSHTPAPSPIPSSPLLRPAESQTGSKSPSPLKTFAPAPAKEREAGDKIILNVISSVISQFQSELESHSRERNFEIGSKDEMGNIRHSLVGESLWIEQMSSTTSELNSEITLLHSEVLQGFKLREEADAQISKSKNPRHFSTMKSRQLDPHSRKTLDDIRSKYQYLQSQLEEVNTRLHLDWVNYTNAMKHKKKRDLPVSETVYNALMKCHTLRTRQEKEVESLCDRLKALEVDSLSRGLRVNRQHNNDDVIATLEKSLNEIKMSPSACVSPVKMLSQGKQEKLQKILSQRNTIPIRKCPSVPKMQLADLSSYSNSSHQNYQDRSPSFQGQTFSISAESSFGPQTYSTPNRNNKTSLGIDGAVPAANARSNNFLSGTKSGISLNSPLMADSVRKIDNGFKVPEFSSGRTLNTSASNKVNVNPGTVGGSISLGIAKPVYEDITPPQTPDKTDVEVKSASPLLALSSLVSKVPTTTAIECVISTSMSDAKSSFAETQLTPNFNSVATSSNPINFSFKPPNTLTSIDISTAKPSPGSEVLTLSSKTLPQFTTSNLSAGQFLGSSITSTQITSTVAPTSALPSVSSVSSTMFSFKGATLGDSTSSGLFTMKMPTASSPFASVGASSTNTNSSIKSSFTAVSSAGSMSLFGGGTLAGQLTLSAVSSPSPVVVTTTGIGQSVKPTTADTKLFSSVSVSPLKGSNEGNDGNTMIPINNAPSVSISTLAPAAATGAEKSSVTNSGFGSDSSVISKLLSSSTATSSTGLFASIKSPEMADKAPTLESSGSGLFGSVFSPPGASTSGTLFQNTTTSSASSGLFEAKSPSSTSVFDATTVSSSVFKSPETTFSSTMFGGSSTGTIFGTAKTTESVSIFGTAKLAESGGLFSPAKTTEGGSIFGTAKTAESGSIFGGSSSSGSIFGGATLSAGNPLGGKLTTPVKSTTEPTPSTPTTTMAGGSVGTVTSPSSAGSLFGAVSTTAISSGGSVFGGVLSTTSSSGAMFNPPGTSSSGTFGSSGTTLAGSTFGSAGTSLAAGSTFGSTGTTSAGSTFGATGTTSAGSTFGSAGTTSAGSTFGQPSAFGGLSTSASAFGTLSTATTISSFTSSGLNVPATTSAGGSVFGQNSESVFGQNTQGSSPSIFGGPSAATGSVFGGTTQSQGSSVFGAPAVQGGSSIFGGPSAQTSGASIFGQSATSTSGNSIGFGQSTSTATSPFASASTTTQQTSSPFSSSGFGVGSTSGAAGGSGGGGGFFSGLGSKPSEENANKNIFGSTSFAGAKPQLGLFGGSGQANSASFGAVAPSTSSFGAGQTSTTSTFGNPGFGGPANTGASGGEVSQGAFGMTTPQKSPGFGNNAAFGGSAVFGGTPSFSSPPKFGSSPAFGGAAAFGSIAGGGGFSNFAAPGTSSTFGAAASPPASAAPGFGGFTVPANSATFGSVAQQSPPQQQSSFGGSSAGPFSGGSSFSTWR